MAQRHTPQHTKAARWVPSPHGTRITPPTNHRTRLTPGTTRPFGASPPGRLQPPESMFSTFLIGIVLASLLALVFLLVAPRPAEDAKTSALPWMGLALAVLFAALGFAGGVAVGS